MEKSIFSRARAMLALSLLALPLVAACGPETAATPTATTGAASTPTAMAEASPTLWRRLPSGCRDDATGGMGEKISVGPRYRRVHGQRWPSQRVAYKDLQRAARSWASRPTYRDQPSRL